MATNDYYQKVLAAQTLGDDSPEMKELQINRAAVENVLRSAFPGAICWKSWTTSAHLP